MAYRIHNQITHGEIDNRTKGWVYGRLWFFGRADPLELRLTGNCLPDLAGCHVSFKNPESAAPEDDSDQLRRIQEGVVGDMTASRKVWVPEFGIDDVRKKYKSGKKIKKKMANAMYLEWFDDFNGRVVVESADYQITISDHSWTMTKEESVRQQEANGQAICEWLERAAAAREAVRDSWDETDSESMNEFEWEKFMREADERTDKYGALMEKYEGHPDSERLIAREMGWTWLEDMLDAEQRGCLPKNDIEDDIFEDVEPLNPNPITEGIDWVRTDSGHISHPLTRRCSDLGTDMWQFAEATENDSGDEDSDIADMVQYTMVAGAKMAGALNSLGYDIDKDPGHIVARLKRSLSFINQALGALENVARKEIHTLQVNRYRSELMSIRQCVLDLMEKYRRRLK